MGLDAIIYDKSEQQIASLRIGNISQVAFLRGIASSVLGEQSVVVSKILFSGSHSGDSLTFDELEPLASELHRLEVASDADLQEFARGMLELVHTALKHERPICFV